MKLFEEIYGSYFQAVRKILLEAGEKPLSVKEMTQLCKEYASPESALAILPKLTEGAWFTLLKEESDHTFSSALKSHKNLESAASSDEASKGLKLPLTSLQKMWLKSILPDPRFCLFLSEEALNLLENKLKEIEPLFELSDFHYFDRCSDSDPYEDPAYKSRFQTILQAMTEKRPLILAYESSKGARRTLEVLPCRLQYSFKNDKFRLLAVSLSQGSPRTPYILNLARIRACHLSNNPSPGRFDWDFSRFQSKEEEPVRIRIHNERNALERCMLHFANYKKQTVYEPESDTWICSIFYDKNDETELLIELLSFGPVIQILGPESFLAQVRNRVRRQHELFYSPYPS